MEVIEEKLIKTELINEEKLDFDESVIANKASNEEIEKDTPDFVNVNNFADVKHEEGSREKYICMYCNKKYCRFEYLQIHEYIHDAGKHCPICKFDFSAKKDFILHINGHMKEKMEDERRSLVCEYCKKTFKKRRALTLHLRVHTNERPYKCHICGKAFKQKGSLTDHNTTHTNIKAFPCEVCPGSFTTASSLRRHMKRVHDAGKTYFCKICSQQMPNYSCLQQHRAENHPEASERRHCPICPMVFKSIYAFRKHKREHENSGEFLEEIMLSKTKYRCILCGVKFLDFKKYVEHKDGHFYYSKEDFQTAQKTGSYSCKLCQRDFQSKQGLFKHMPFHMEKTEKCNVCEELFSYFAFSRHKVHTPIECKICKEIVEGKGKLTRHYSIAHPDYNRSRDRKYACHICDKHYMSKYPLDLHMQIYHGKTGFLKSHKCNFCARIFMTRATLGVHMSRMHPTSARFKCDSCDILFPNRAKLLKHNSTHHRGTVKRRQKNRSRVCTICNQEFPTLPSLKHHMKIKHKVVQSPTQFQCKICLKYFKDFRNRMIHLENKVCTKFFEKMKKDSHKCAVCQRNFALKNLLVAHMVVHSKFYNTCRFCNKKFTRAPTLKAHIEQTHPGEKVYYCGICDVEFDEALQLRTHRYSPGHRSNVECKTEVLEDSDVKNDSEDKIFVKEDVEIKKEPVEDSL